MFKISDEIMNDDLIKKYLSEKDDSKFLIEINKRKDIGFKNGAVQVLDKKTIRINTHDCLDCTLKHLSSAIVEMGELQKGWWNTYHEIFCMGNLAEASEQIAGFSLEIANKLRELRRDIFEISKAVTSKHIEDGKAIYWEVKAIKTGQKRDDKAIMHDKTSNVIVHKPCGGCGKNKGNQTTDNAKTLLDNPQ